MIEIIKIYNQTYGDILLTLIRVLIGILLIVNEKYVSRRFKYGVIVIYFGMILGGIISGYFDFSIKGILLGSIIGLIMGCIIVKYHKTDHIANLLFLLIYFYEIIGCIFYIFNINFSEILGIYNYDIDYKTIYATIIFSIILTVISYIVFYNKSNFIKIIEENKYFWIGNYFVIGAVIGFGTFPIYGPGDWNEMSIELLNVTDDFQLNCVVMLEIMMLLAYRGYKKSDK
ncbi:hypothetical protein [uncultured Eubacterium sp.]|uniref:hypothetical protein n=1 Tax=Eubacterium sp. TaxID=142586 RepID=UPI0026712494|nr:hypothetical protein [uncultured Eubacterium sp.]